MYKKTCLALAVLALGGCRIVSQQELADLKSPAQSAYGEHR
ncbi:putative lipoprotein (plasmid) [Klebsiella aerogenes]|nr:putative lipoprotein [Klebsiella aerogenes]